MWHSKIQRTQDISSKQVKWRRWTSLMHCLSCFPSHDRQWSVQSISPGRPRCTLRILLRTAPDSDHQWITMGTELKIYLSSLDQMSNTTTHFLLQVSLKIWQDVLESSSYDVHHLPFSNYKDSQWLNKPINNIPIQVAGACPDQVTTLLSHNYNLWCEQACKSAQQGQRRSPAGFPWNHWEGVRISSIPRRVFTIIHGNCGIGIGITASVTTVIRSCYC